MDDRVDDCEKVCYYSSELDNTNQAACDVIQVVL